MSCLFYAEGAHVSSSQMGGCTFVCMQEEANGRTCRFIAVVVSARLVQHPRPPWSPLPATTHYPAMQIQ